MQQSRSSGASISIDRREAYYERAAGLIAKDPLDFYLRAEAGRKVQGNIKPKDLKPFAPVIQPAPESTNVINWPKVKHG